MGGDISSFVDRLGQTGKALGALGFVASAAVTVTLLLVSFFGLPEQVRANTSAIAKNSVQIQQLIVADEASAAKADRIICILLLPEGTLPLQAEQDCK